MFSDNNMIKTVLQWLGKLFPLSVSICNPFPDYLYMYFSGMDYALFPVSKDKDSWFGHLCLAINSFFIWITNQDCIFNFQPQVHLSTQVPQWVDNEYLITYSSSINWSSFLSKKYMCLCILLLYIGVVKFALSHSNAEPTLKNISQITVPLRATTWHTFVFTIATSKHI